MLRTCMFALSMKKNVNLKTSIGMVIQGFKKMAWPKSNEVFYAIFHTMELDETS